MPPVLQLSTGTAMNEAIKRRLEARYTPIQTQPAQEQFNGNHQRRGIAQSGVMPDTVALVNRTDESHSEHRGLPSRTVSDEQFDDVYVSFILYCNPSIPMHTDTTELRKIFRAPPKSDRKTFSPFSLFELIQRLENKELKTWAQLAIELGVEPPSDGQSAQKIQQYCVRLKRWMHAMHVDAFFEYLLGKAHIYWSRIPSVHEPISELGRDGVAADEDLALRALLPETRPKRGRRKAEDRDNDSDVARSPAQRPRLDSPTLSEDFMMARSSLIADNGKPASAHPGFQQNFESRTTTWSAVDGRIPLGDAFNWGSTIDNMQTPSTAYPKTAITPSDRAFAPWSESHEPRSAITPNKSKFRHRQGSTVSSAWPSNGSTTSGKLRGRPPSNRSITDGPFSTFPVNPGRSDAPTMTGATPSATPSVANSEGSQLFSASARASPTPSKTQTPNTRPPRLQLQVPQRQGGSIKPASPPPVILLNGGGNLDIQGARHVQQSSLSNELFNALGDDESSLQHFASIAFRQNEERDRTNVDVFESHFKWEILAAEWYDSVGNSIERCTIDEADQICKEVVKNIKAESSSREAFLLNLSGLAGVPFTSRLRMARLQEQGLKVSYECHREMRFSSIEGNFTTRATIQKANNAIMSRGAGDDNIEASWKQRYVDLQQKIRERDQKEGSLKRSILDALISSNKHSQI